MTYDEALKHFGTGRAIGDALGVSSSRVSQCRTTGGFSYPMQCVLEKESCGALIAKREDDPAQAVKQSA
ncbi:helix-turn-helix domain-containing protein [Pseudomonas mohnii]